MKTLQFEVDGQYISRKDNLVPVAKCRNLYKAHFEFLSPEWEGTKTAIFSQRSYSKAQVLDEKNECAIPWEFFDTDIDIRGTVSVFCGDLVTANNAYVSIEKTGYKDSDASVPPTPDVYQQILERLDQVSGLTPEDLAKAVEEYLAKNPIELTPIDKTLTKEGQASDAKATGDRLKEKIDKNQGAENNGKILGIGADGMVALVEKPSGGGDGIPIINTMSGASPLVVTDSAERVNKGMSIIGNTVQKQDPPPSPSNPQEIKNVGKWNEETQKYEVDVKVTGKNIVNIPDFGVNTPDTAIKCYISKNICISAQEKADVSKSVWRFKALHKDGSLEYITDATLPGCFYATKENPIVTITYRGIYMTREYKGIMVEYGTVATKYEPYKEQTLTLTSDRPITKWDKLVEQDGQIGWLYKAVFDSDVRPSRMDLFPSGFSLYKDHLNGVFTYKAGFAKKEIGWQTSICKQFKNVNGSYDSGTLWNYSDQPAIDSVYFNSNIATLESFVKWMEENPLEMVYKSRESEFIPLQQSEQDAIRALTTYYPTTVVTVDGGEVIPSVELTYTADTKNYIDGKIASYHAMAQANQIAMMSLLPDETQATMIEKDQENLLGGI